MRYAEKLLKHMLLKGLNQQRLARLSEVSDSEVSRILSGKSQPGLENAYKLAQAVGVSLDYLADDALESDPAECAPADGREVLAIAEKIGFRAALRILDVVNVLGFEVSIRRLYGAESKPIIEVGDPSRPTVAPTVPVGRASSA